MRPRLLAVLLALAAFALASAYFLSQPVATRLAPFSDREYIARAERSAQARAFLAKYPRAARSVDRSGAVAVDFREQRGDRYLRLRVIIDAYANRPLDFFVDCSGTALRVDVLEYLRSETCLGS